MTTSELPSSRHLMLIPDVAQAKFCDTLDIDHETSTLYAGDNWSAGIDVFDITTPLPRYLRTIRARGRIFGVVVAKNVFKLFVGTSGSVVAVIDIDPKSKTAWTLVAEIHTGGSGHTDLLDYDSAHKRLFAANRLDGFMVTIDATHNEVTGRTDGLGKGLEQPRFNPSDGMVYLTDNVENVLYQIEPDSNRLLNTFEIGDACYPNGLAINPQTNQALMACSNRERPHTLIWDLKTQSVAEVIDECGCGDGAIYDSKANLFFFAAACFSEGPVIGVFDGDSGHFLMNIATVRGASWAAYDRANQLVYAPAVKDWRPGLISVRLPDEILDSAK
jgi:hypothetical protein